MKLATKRKIRLLKILHQDQWVIGSVVDVSLNNGKKIKNFLMVKERGPGWVSVCARTSDGKFLLVQQCKPAAGFSFEAIAGGKKTKESWGKAAIREMIEEVRFEPKKLLLVGNRQLGIFTQTDRIVSRARLFLAFGCKRSNKRYRGDEKQGVKPILLTPEKTLKLIKTGKIRDMTTIVGIFAHLLHEKGVL